jgi:Protein of unknown function (DUF3810)
VRVPFVIIGLALLVAVVPAPAWLVERWYSMGVYPSVQSAVTSFSNRVPVSLLDVASVVLIVIGIGAFVRRAQRSGVLRAVARGGLSLLVAAAAIYLVFVAMWGLNYRRVPLEARLDYDRGRISAAAALALAERSVIMLNEGHAAAHALTPDLTRLDASFAEAQRTLGATRVAVTGRPKASLLRWYLPRAAIDGMTDPFFLEIIVNPEVLDFERPFVVAHEWSHLAGYANESEANFVAWLTCVRGDALARYSGWLAAYEHVVQVLPRDERRALALGPGPIEDLRASAERYRRSSPAIRSAARNLNDRYLKANRVSEGIGSYEAVLRLLLGTGFDAEGRPLLRKGS